MSLSEKINKLINLLEEVGNAVTEEVNKTGKDLIPGTEEFEAWFNKTKPLLMVQYMTYDLRHKLKEYEDYFGHHFK